MGLNRPDGGQIAMKNVTLRFLVTFAWDIQDHQLAGGPAWLDTAHFDIVAKPEAELPRTPEGNERLRRMVQTLLADRFGLAIHRETKEMPVYDLVAAKSGPKLVPGSEPGKNSLMMGRGRIEGKSVKTADLAKLLSSPLSRTVIDRTGLTGDYDFTLQWTPDTGETVTPKGLPEGPVHEAAPQAPDGPSLFTAIQEQLGLKLAGSKGPVEMVVIDRAAMPSDN